jgi:cell division protein FtsX
MTLAAALLLVKSSVLEHILEHGIGFHQYLALTWMASAMAVFGGAIGSGLEREIDIRAAAYSYHPELEETD